MRQGIGNHSLDHLDRCATELTVPCTVCDEARRLALANLCIQTDLVEQAASVGHLVAGEAAKVKGARLWFTLFPV